MPNNIVVKKDGKFEIVPSDADVARALSVEDKNKIKTKLTDEELSEILVRILVRLEVLEKGAV